MNEDRIIIEVEVDAGKSAEDLANVRSRMDALKDAQKRLKAEMKELQAVQLKNGQMNAEDARTLAELNRQYADNAGELKQLTAQEKVYTSQIQIATQNDRKYGDSIIELGAQLAQLKQQYRSLSAEQRESEAGKALQKQIAGLDEQVKQFDSDLGDHQRNVGNYTSALLGLNGNVAKVAELFQTGLAAGLKTAGTALKSFAKTLLATPLGWILAGVAAVVKVFQQLREAFKRNDDAGTALSVALSRLQPVITFVREAFNALAKSVATVVGWVTKAATAVLGLIPAYRDAAAAAAEVVTAQDRLEDSRREFTKNEAERDRQIAELRKKAVGDEKLTAKEREDIYRQIDELSRKNMEERKRIAAENYRILQQQAKQEGDTSDAMKDRLAQAYAEMIKAQTEYLTETTRISSRESQARQEQQKEEEARRKAAQQAAREAAQKRVEAKHTETEELRKLEDLQLQTIRDAAQRAEAEIRLRYNRQIEDLQKRLDEEKNLTAAARAAINGQIVALNAERDAKLKEMGDIATKEAIDRENEAQRMILEAQIAGMKDATDRQMAELNLRYDTEIDTLNEQLATKADLTESETEALNAKIAQLETEQAAKVAEIRASANRESIKKLYEDTAQQYANDLQRQLLQIGDDALAASEATLAAAESEHARLLAMDRATKDALGISQTDYETMVIESERRVAEARKATQESFKQQVGEIGDTMHAVTGALSDLFGAASEDSEQYEKFKKAMAIVDAMISMATTIAQAVSVSTAGDPYTMAVRIAANVAAVTAQFASVISAIKAAAVPSAPSFERGGIVPGTSYTGDNVTTRLNSREMVLTLQQQGNLFDLINAGLPRGGIDYRRLAAAFAEGAAQLPAPTLVYREFKAFERDVAMSEAKMR